MDINEVKSHMKENPEFKKELLGSIDGYVVKSSEEFESLKSNIANEAISKKTSEFASSIEKDIFETTNIAKEQDEKWFDYQKRVLGSLGEKAKKVSSYQKQLEEAKANTSTLDETIKQEYQELKKAIPELEERYKNEILSLQNDNKKERKSWEISSAIGQMSFSKTLPETLVDLAKKSAVQDLMTQKSEFRDGKLVFLDDNGETLRNKDNNLEPFSAGDLLKNKLAEVLAVKSDASGLGTSPKDATQTVEGIALDPSIKTQVDLDRKLGEKGLSTSSDEYIKERNAYIKGYAEANGGRAMPLR